MIKNTLFYLQDQFSKLKKISLKNLITYFDEQFNFINKKIIIESHQAKYFSQILTLNKSSFQKQMSLRRVNEPKNLPQTKQKKELYDKIEKDHKDLARAEQKISQLDNRIKKVVQSNVRNAARLLRHKARLQQLMKAKSQPQLLLGFSGIINEYVQTFMISHNFEMNVDLTNVNPDTMSYQQLLELGEKIGKVSKGLTKEEIETLDHLKIKKKDECCPICCTELAINELAIVLICKHIYHEECILKWFQDENCCPICKQYVLKDKKVDKR